MVNAERRALAGRAGRWRFARVLLLVYGLGLISLPLLLRNVGESPGARLIANVFVFVLLLAPLPLLIWRLARRRVPHRHL